MTEAQRKLLELDLKKAEITKYYEEVDAALVAVRAEIGIDGYFQSDDGCVYKVAKPKGRYVQFKELEYLRTKRADEKAGTLSVKEAESKGFKVK